MPKRKINKIEPDPNQPRKHFTDSYIKKLADNLKQEGMIHPIEIDRKGMIIVGECRWRAAKLLGWTVIPVTIHRKELPPYNRLRRQLSENLIRTSSSDNEQMNPIDIAQAYAKLIKLAGYKWSPGDHFNKGRLGTGLRKIASEVGIKHSTVAEYLELLSESKEAQKKIQLGEIPRTVFREISYAPKGMREELKKDIIDNWGTKYKAREDVRKHIKALISVSPAMRKLLAEHSKLKEDGKNSKRLVNKIIELGIVVGETKEIDPINFNVVAHHIDWLQEELTKFRAKMFSSIEAIEGTAIEK